MRDNNLKIGLIGKDGRTSAIEKCLHKSSRVGKVVRLSDWKNEATTDAAISAVLRAAQREKVDFVIVGPEEPLEAGIVNELHEVGVPCVGPTKILAQLESSKAFTRDLVTKYGIPGNPEHRIFTSINGIESYLRSLGEYVVKPDGLTGGKGVKVSNSHLFSIEEAMQYCRELLKPSGARVIIEEKLDGEEFSLMAFCDGTTVVDMVVVQDHKRVGEGDSGPNTGGMGSYSCADHKLPFLEKDHLSLASEINQRIADALFQETGQRYKGILYGGFMATQDGVRLLEYNARFGDPETLNVLSILKTDLVDICEAIIDGTLHRLEIVFEKKATVCKYVVPERYPENPVNGRKIELGIQTETANLRIYEAAVRHQGQEIFLTGSRAIGFVGIGDTLQEAQLIAEEAASAVRGPVFHRRDIGTHALIEQRMNHMRTIQQKRGSRLLEEGGRAQTGRSKKVEC